MPSETTGADLPQREHEQRGGATTTAAATTPRIRDGGATGRTEGPRRRGMRQR